MIVTNCNKCCFYRDDSCLFNVPNTLVQNLSMIFTPEKIQKNNIYDFYCPYARTTAWLDHKLSTTTEEQTINEVLNQKPSFVMFYFLDDNICNLESNLDILLSQPEYIYFVCKKNQNLDDKKYLSLIESKNLKNWKYHSIVNNDMTECEIIDMILTGAEVSSELIYIINNKYNITQEQIDSVLTCFNLSRYHQVVFIPSDIFTFHNIIIPMTLWKHSSDRIGLAFENIEQETNVIKFTL